MRLALPLLVATLLASRLPAQSSSAPEHVGNLLVYHEKDAIDDSERSRAVVIAERGAALVPAVLGWQCRGPDDVVLFVRNLPYGPGDRRVNVTWRFDQAAPHTSAWEVDDHGFAYFEGDDDAFADFIDDFRSSSTLALRATSLGGEQATFIFHLEGSDRALNRIPCMVQHSAAPAPAAKP